MEELIKLLESGEIFPYEYVGGGHFRKKYVGEGEFKRPVKQFEKSETVHGKEAVDVVIQEVLRMLTCKDHSTNTQGENEC